MKTAICGRQLGLHPISTKFLLGLVIFSQFCPFLAEKTLNKQVRKIYLMLRVIFLLHSIILSIFLLAILLIIENATKKTYYQFLN